MPNIEIKASFSDHSSAIKSAERLGGILYGVDEQVDTYFTVPEGRLKLRESSLHGAQLIPYSRPNTQGPKRSDYAVIPIAEPAHVKALFSALLGVEIIVRKHRTIYLINNVRVHLDKVDGLGNYFEFEAVYTDPKEEAQEEAKVAKLVAEFSISPEHLIEGSYRELVMKHEKNCSHRRPELGQNINA